MFANHRKNFWESFPSLQTWRNLRQPSLHQDSLSIRPSLSYFICSSLTKGHLGLWQLNHCLAILESMDLQRTCPLWRHWERHSRSLKALWLSPLTTGDSSVTYVKTSMLFKGGSAWAMESKSYTPARKGCIHQFLFSELIFRKSTFQLQENRFRELISRKSHITHSFLIQRITWKNCWGIIVLENLISVTWNDVFGN